MLIKSIKSSDKKPYTSNSIVSTCWKLYSRMYNAHKNGLQNHTFVFSIEFNLVLASNYSIFEEKKKKSIRLQILQSLRVDICSACRLFKEILQASLKMKQSYHHYSKYSERFGCLYKFIQYLHKLLNHHSVNLASLICLYDDPG